MRLLVLSLLFGCSSLSHSSPATPSAPTPRSNRVCAMVEMSPRWTGAVCTDKGSNELHGDVAQVELDGGEKVCWETFDSRSGFDCVTFLLSRAEAVAIDAKRESDAKDAAASKAPQTSSPATPAPKEDKPRGKASK